MTNYKCYLPWRGEFGWMIMCFVKSFHADSHPNKIICCKPGHECLFPSASKFFYDWSDIPDSQKAGAAEMQDENTIIEKITNQFTKEKIEFVRLSEFGWHNKHNFSKHTFIPQSKIKLGLKTDIVITPRNRSIDVHRNWTQDKWQQVVNGLNKQGITVGVCGNRETSFDLNNVLYKAYDHIDVDSDVELMNNAKLIVTQESGLQYLSFMCEKPTFCIDYYEGALGPDIHRNPNVFFKYIEGAWDYPDILVQDIINFLKEHNDSNL
jgi:hypothetical protein